MKPLVVVAALSFLVVSASIPWDTKPPPPPPPSDVPPLQHFLQQNKKPSVIYVNNKTGNDTECVRDVDQPCASLEMVSSLLRDDMIIEIQTDIILNSIFELKESTNISLVGVHENSTATQLVKISCGKMDARLIINGVNQFKFTNLAVNGCDIISHKCSVLITGSTDVILKDAWFENAALVLKNNRGDIMIMSTTFMNNSKCSCKSNHTPRVYYSYPGGLSVEQAFENSDEWVNYSIIGSNFCYNQLLDPTNIPGSSRTHSYGGAVFIEFSRSTSNSSVSIMDSSFTGNKAARGGAVYGYFKDDAKNNTINIETVVFEKNNAAVSGGGLNIGYANSPASMNVFSVTHCTFRNNNALIGAGLAIYSGYGDRKPTHTTFAFANSEWLNNHATFSAAVDVAPVSGSSIVEGYLPVPEFTNCTFVGNTLNAEHNMHDQVNATFHINAGVFSITKFHVLFCETTMVIGNSNSAILLESGIAEFQSGSTVLFENNTGYNGGAIAMYAFSTILFNEYSDITFFGNKADNYGGAIYYQTGDQHAFLKGAKQCFLMSTLNESMLDTLRVSFDHNNADIEGMDIYSESFNDCYYKCKRFFNSSDFQRNITNIFSCAGNFTYSDSKKSPLTSSGRLFKFYDNCTGDSISDCRTHFVFPGESFDLPFTVQDDFNNNITPLLSITKMNTSTNNTICVNNTYSLTGTVLPLGRSNDFSMFKLTSIGVRQIYFKFKIVLIECPPGYHNLDSKTCKCASGKEGYSQISKCNDSEYQAIFKDDYWVGYIPEGSSNLYFAPCSTPLCNVDNHHLPKNGTDLNELICNGNRRGIMCGTCAENHSSYFHSRNLTCGDSRYCHMGMLFYLLSEILPMICFFIVVVTFDINFTSGNAVGFIFFTQYLNRLTIPIPIFSYLRSPYRVFYGLFNFEFFNIEELSFCLWQNAQVLDVLVFKYVTISIAFGLVLAFIAIMNHTSCSNLCRLRRRVSAKTSVVHGLSGFLVICYAQCTRTSFYILKYSVPLGYNGVAEKHYSYYGGLPYFHGRHLLYAIPALMSLVFVTILPPLVLLLYPLSLHLLSLCGLSEHWIVNKTLRLTGINKLMPFIDCFQSCYKDRLRFFAGLYFVYRVAILLMFTIELDGLRFSIYCELLIILFLGVHSTVQPYKEDIHNTIDSLLFSNLALVNICVVISKEILTIRDDPISSKDRFLLAVSSVQLVLLYLPMFTALYWLFKYCFAQPSTRDHDGGAGGGGGGGGNRDDQHPLTSTSIGDILDQDSEHSSIACSTRSMEDTGNTGNTSTSRRTDYGSFEDTY